MNDKADISLHLFFIPNRNCVAPMYIKVGIVVLKQDKMLNLLQNI
jgi:hypothetical protein